MTINDIEQRFWELQGAGSLTLQEVGFMAFLIGRLRRNPSTDSVLRWSDSYLCRELSISRNQLRKLRLRLIELGLLIIQTSQGKGGGTMYKLSPVETVTEVELSPVGTIRPQPSCVETVSMGILYPVSTVSVGIIYPVETVYSGFCTPPSPCSPLAPSSSPQTPLSSPPISPTNPSPLREADRERGNELPIPEAICKTHRQAEGTDGKPVPTMEEVVAYFEEKGYLNPQREGEKFWLMRYWENKPGMHWRQAASLWNDRAISYQEKHHAADRSTHSNRLSRDEKQKRNLELIRAHRAAAQADL